MTSDKHTLWLHIGHAKCASTTIQSALVRNADTLRRRGFLVADENMEFPAAGPLQGPPVLTVAAWCEDRERGLREATACFQQLDEQLRRGPHTQAIVSAESLTIPEADYLCRAIQHVFDVRVLFYIRRQDDYLLSAWQQWGCREGLGLRAYVERALANGNPNYPKIIERWAGSGASLRVRPLHASALAGGDVVSDFFSAIGAGFQPDRTQAANVSLDVAITEVFAASPFLFSSQHDTGLSDWIRANLPDGYAATKARMPTELGARIRRQFLAGNRALHAQFFPEVEFEHAFGPVPEAATEAGDGPAEQASLREELAGLRRVAGLHFAMLRQLRERLDGGRDG